MIFSREIPRSCESMVVADSVAIVRPWSRQYSCIRQSLLATCLLGILWTVSLSQQTLAAPNVILIVIDDLGWADLGCYGSKFHRTPNLDRLAAEGMRFTEAYAACPVCSPTRSAVMTGKYPARLHITDWIPGGEDEPGNRLLRPKFRQELPLEETTIAEVLRSAGYATASIGKWHLGGAGFEPTRQGFDINIAGDQVGSPPTYFAPYRKNGRVIPNLQSAPTGEYLTDRLTSEAEKFIDEHRQQPFFLYLPHFAVHTPLMAQEDLIAEYKSRPPHGQQANPVYAAMLECVDNSIGRLMQKLTDLKLADNTVILFTSDNGGLATTEGAKTPATNNAPLREGKGYLYEGGIRVPLLIKWPGRVRPGSQCASAVCSIDLFPTIAAICGVPSDAKYDGESMEPLLRQTGEIKRDSLYWHYPHYSNQGGKPGGAVRRGDFKLIEFYERGRLELYNIKKDAGENVNLAEQLPDLTQELASLLAAWRDDAGVQMMTPNPHYRPNPQAADGTIVLPGAAADVHVTMLRYEPLPHKRTLGYWTKADDSASWEFEVTQPGKFKCLVLQGCGPGSGGSEVEFRFSDQALAMTVEATRGFQDFIEREIGQLTIDTAGRHSLTVKPRTKPGPAVMDLRQVKLVPVVGS